MNIEHVGIYKLKNVVRIFIHGHKLVDKGDNKIVVEEKAVVDLNCKEDVFPIRDACESFIHDHFPKQCKEWLQYMGCTGHSVLATPMTKFEYTAEHYGYGQPIDSVTSDIPGYNCHHTDEDGILHDSWIEKKQFEEWHWECEEQ